MAPGSRSLAVIKQESISLSRALVLPIFPAVRPGVSTESAVISWLRELLETTPRRSASGEKYMCVETRPREYGLVESGVLGILEYIICYR